MGIKGLNRYIRENCKKSTKLFHLSNVTGKKIAVDTSIFLYKYEGEGALMENMYRMLSIFRYYGVIPLFVFDGAPPTEKKALLQYRRERKELAINNCAKMEEELLSTRETGIHNEDQYKMIELLNQTKKQCVYMTREKINQVKELIHAMGASYVDAIGEAEELCAHMVLSCGFWACLSDDTDLFVYGCPRVLRYMSLMNHTVVSYDMNGILEELKLTQNEFMEICVFAGTDYSFEENVSGQDQEGKLVLAFQCFDTYKNTKDDQDMNFYTWLQYIHFIDSETMNLYEKIKLMFDLTKKDTFFISLPLFKDNTENLILKKVRKESLRYLLKNSGFLFYENDRNISN